MDISILENIIIHDVTNRETYDDLFVSPPPSQERKYILINLICGTLKEDVQENYSCLLNWIKEIAKAAEKEGTDIWLLVDNKFPNLRNDLNQYATNLFYLKEQKNVHPSKFHPLLKRSVAKQMHLLQRNTPASMPG